jgi:uncharacterized RDD family membrane protein YckC
MENLNIETSQNIDLEHSVASIGERILAHLIDYLLFGTYGIIIMVLTLNHVLHTNGITFYVITFLPLLLYDLVCELKFNGQNVGKRLMKLQVVKLDGSQPDFISYFIRWIFRLVENLMLFGGISSLTIIINGRGQRIGDIAAGTAVVRCFPKQSFESLLQYQLPENYSPVFPNCYLNEKEYNIICKILQYSKENGFNESVEETMASARAKLEKKRIT